MLWRYIPAIYSCDALLIEVDLEADCAQISIIFFSHEPDCICVLH
jgi:hypothetical protein